MSSTRASCQDARLTSTTGSSTSPARRWPSSRVACLRRPSWPAAGKAAQYNRPVMAYENLLVERSDGVMVVTINRPKVLNALNAQTLTELSHVIDEAAREDDVRVVVLTGAGDRSFVA